MSLSNLTFEQAVACLQMGKSVKRPALVTGRDGRKYPVHLDIDGPAKEALTCEGVVASCNGLLREEDIDAEDWYVVE